MWPSANRASTPTRFVLIANPGSRRADLFSAALAAAHLPPPHLVPWLDLLTHRSNLSTIIRPGDAIRLESPGKDFEVERALLAAGSDEPDEDDPHATLYDRAPRAAINSLTFDKGRILYPRQWYLGFRSALRTLSTQLAAAPSHLLLNDPAETAVMFDKRLCHTRLAAANIPVPAALPPINSFADLTTAMHQTGHHRVFIKLAHGSSGSGVVAYQTSGAGPATRHHAVTTVEMVRTNGHLHLYNSRRLRTYTALADIAPLVDALARHRAHVEQWVPKAGLDGRTFDLRVLVIAGRARHTIARLSRSPITNLHLLNDRADPAPIRRRAGEQAWSAAMTSCERAATECFPHSLHAGVDLLLSTDYHRHAILEVNAFGDLLPNVLHENADTYAAEISSITRSRSPQTNEDASPAANRPITAGHSAGSDSDQSAAPRRPARTSPSCAPQVACTPCPTT